MVQHFDILLKTPSGSDEEVEPWDDCYIPECKQRVFNINAVCHLPENDAIYTVHATGHGIAVYRIVVPVLWSPPGTVHLVHIVVCLIKFHWPVDLCYKTHQQEVEIKKNVSNFIPLQTFSNFSSVMYSIHFIIYFLFTEIIQKHIIKTEPFASNTLEEFIFKTKRMKCKDWKDCEHHC